MKDKLFNKFALFSSVVPKYHSILKKLQILLENTIYGLLKIVVMH